MAELLKGAQVADALNASLGKEIEALESKGVHPRSPSYVLESAVMISLTSAAQ